jgi:secreted trypsin-like serine protease
MLVTVVLLLSNGFACPEERRPPRIDIAVALQDATSSNKDLSDDRKFVAAVDEKLKQRVSASRGIHYVPLPIEWADGARPMYANLRRLMMSNDILVYEGQAKAFGEYPECVVLGNSRGDWVCSGVLVGRNAVLSARHCFEDYHADHLYLGSNPANRYEGGKTFDLDLAKTKCFASASHDAVDACVAMLTEKVDKTLVPVGVPIATSADIDAAWMLTLVGFGGSGPDNLGGIKREGHIAMAAPRCQTLTGSNPKDCECVPDYELGAQALLLLGYISVLGQGACHGDSGGPIYVSTYKTRKLAAIASCFRSDKNDCSRALNLYVRADNLANEIAKLNWYVGW